MSGPIREAPCVPDRRKTADRLSKHEPSNPSACDPTKKAAFHPVNHEWRPLVCESDREHKGDVMPGPQTGS
jgi:hypothetical protein